MAVLRAVCFDLMDTVIVDPYRSAVMAGTGMDTTEAHRFTDPDAWPAFERGEIDEADYARRFFATGDHRLDLVAFNEAREAGYAFVPGMRELLVDLAPHVTLYAASNYPVWIEPLRERFALDGYFAAIWASHHLGVRKPEPEFFSRLLAEIAEPAQACMFVDDRRRNCEAAASTGMRVHLFKGAEQLREELGRLGVPVA